MFLGYVTKLFYVFVFRMPFRPGQPFDAANENAAEKAKFDAYCMAKAREKDRLAKERADARREKERKEVERFNAWKREEAERKKKEAAYLKQMAQGKAWKK